MKAFVFVEVPYERGAIERVMQELFKIAGVNPEGLDGRIVGEHWSIVCKIHKKRVKDIEALHRQIRRIPGVTATSLAIYTRTNHQ